MSVGRICSREVEVISPRETAETAAGRLAAHQVGTLVVVDNDMRPVGILTDRDLALRVLGAGLGASTPVGDVMTSAPKAVSESTPVEDALRLMRAGKFRRVPVVDSQERLAGLLSLDDILDLLAEEFEQIGELLREEQPRAHALA
jgi:CBS domain-containing protein